MSDLKRIVVSALKRHPICQGLSARELADLLDHGEIRRFAAGEYLSREGDEADAYWLLCRGSARVFYSSPDGAEVTVKIFRAPAAWAEMEVLTRHPHIEDCTAVDRCTVLRVPRASFLTFLDQSPRFVRNVLYDTSARFLIAAQNEKALAFMTVPQRLAHLLLSYVRIYGVPVQGGVGIRIRLTQEELANGLGAARRSVTRVLAEWQRLGIVSRRSLSYVIHDPARLASLSREELVGVDWVAGSNIREGHGATPRAHDWDDFTPARPARRPRQR